ncbi:MAG: biopolymer transporter ExbD [Spirochaetes bacterium GWD1_61_31]|nr:MAG: biopolymer transporter ExbD [Spirochaetes bacterium GWB1_60_80]OHD31836.1 MAG: biopolymer transporter ExbD [Spirochaetes bacterium GWC1_61_12]OHD40069.1 MAG: biopolymer transporter ExbD [Spirochaetes bacterium GWD1_61_31]OHD45882.1 MAG: biopolymer transporter ExbD [Spirochaetes bacterium GWE1_60_18]OHD58426.1 MAG: biopolymer transporter ExbD [Spirochaetes bacterium GWF1_60_12]HAW85408.1 biopolymer transporter ExbD [Spirochaetaceae bacterium]
MIIERRLKPNIMVDLTPLIDVVFQLVIFFMISSTFKTAPGIDLTLPDSSTAAVITVAELTVSATAAGDVYINKVLTNAQGAAAVIASETAGKDPASLQVSLSADSDVPYQVIVQLLDALRQNGIDAVGLVTNQPRPEAP